MKISKILLTSLLAASVATSCKNNTRDKNKKHTQQGAINKNLENDTIQNTISDNDCPACGKG